jgi:hypothetical protein
MSLQALWWGLHSEMEGNVVPKMHLKSPWKPSEFHRVGFHSVIMHCFLMFFASTLYEIRWVFEWTFGRTGPSELIVTSFGSGCCSKSPWTDPVKRSTHRVELSEKKSVKVTDIAWLSQTSRVNLAAKPHKKSQQNSRGSATTVWSRYAQRLDIKSAKKWTGAGLQRSDTMQQLLASVLGSLSNIW